MALSGILMKMLEREMDHGAGKSLDPSDLVHLDLVHVFVLVPSGALLITAQP
jgi:hypothetical protein